MEKEKKFNNRTQFFLQGVYTISTIIIKYAFLEISVGGRKVIISKAMR